MDLKQESLLYNLINCFKTWLLCGEHSGGAHQKQRLMTRKPSQWCRQHATVAWPGLVASEMEKSTCL